MLKGNRTALLGKGLLIAVVVSLGAWTVGCGHDDAQEHRSQHAGWHERGSYDHGYDQGYDRSRDSDYNHDYR